MAILHFAFSRSIVALGVAMALAGCGADYHQQQVQPNGGGPVNQLSVGTVQREIRTGMSGAEVAQALGSPNIVTTDEQRRETWIYDKISSNASYSNSSAYGTILILGASGASGASSTSQQTLTVIIKFDQDKRVRDFAYHTSRF